MIQRESRITTYGVTRITDSVLTLVYCVLLAQGKTGFSISGSNGLSKITVWEFLKLHCNRVESGDIVQNIRNAKAAMGLMNPGGTWIDIAKGIVRVPESIVQHKLVGTANPEGPVIVPVKEVVKGRRRVLEDEVSDSESVALKVNNNNSKASKSVDSGSESEASESEDESESEASEASESDESDSDEASKTLKTGLILSAVLVGGLLIKRRWVNRRR